MLRVIAAGARVLSALVPGQRRAFPVAEPARATTGVAGEEDHRP